MKRTPILVACLLIGCSEDGAFVSEGNCRYDMAPFAANDDGDTAGPYLVDGEAEWVKVSDCSFHLVVRYALNDDEDDATAASVRDSIVLWTDQEGILEPMVTRPVGEARVTPKNAGSIIEQRVCLERFVKERHQPLAMIVRDEAGNQSNVLCLRTFATAENAPAEGIPEGEGGV